MLSHRGVEYTLAAPLRPSITSMVLGKTVTLGELQSACAPAPAEQVAAFVTDMLGRGVFVLATP